MKFGIETNVGVYVYVNCPTFLEFFFTASCSSDQLPLFCSIPGFVGTGS